jgi:hypothetical protein
MKSIRMLTLVPVLLAVPVLTSQSAGAAEWKFNVINRGSHPALEFRTQEEGEWSENWLESRLEPGDGIELDFETDKGNCTVRTQIRFTDGSYFDANVNYCQVKTLYIHDDRLTGG